VLQVRDRRPAAHRDPGLEQVVQVGVWQCEALAGGAPHVVQVDLHEHASPLVEETLLRDPLGTLSQLRGEPERADRTDGVRGQVHPCAAT
jgi:hypothetical protein